MKHTRRTAESVPLQVRVRQFVRAVDELLVGDFDRPQAPRPRSARLADVRKCIGALSGVAVVAPYLNDVQELLDPLALGELRCAWPRMRQLIRELPPAQLVEEAAGPTTERIGPRAAMRGKPWLKLAKLELMNRPWLPDRAIAARVGVAPSTLSRSVDYRKARERIRREAAERRVRGVRLGEGSVERQVGPDGV